VEKKGRFQVYGGELWCPDSIVLLDTWSGKWICEYHSPDIEKSRELEEKETAWASWLNVIASMLNQTCRWAEVLPFQFSELVGRHIRLTKDVERFPTGIVTQGATGRIIDAHRQQISVKLDAHHEFLDEWDNELHFYPEAEPLEFQLTTEFIEPPEFRTHEVDVRVKVRSRGDIEFDEANAVSYVTSILHGSDRIQGEDEFEIRRVEEKQAMEWCAMARVRFMTNRNPEDVAKEIEELLKRHGYLADVFDLDAEEDQG